MYILEQEHGKYVRENGTDQREGVKVKDMDWIKESKWAGWEGVCGANNKSTVQVSFTGRIAFPALRSLGLQFVCLVCKIKLQQFTHAATVVYGPVTKWHAG